MNELLQQFHFVRPWWLLAAAPALICAYFLWQEQKQDQQLNRLFNPVFLTFLVDQTQIQQQKWPIFGILGLWIFTVVALAGPAWKKIPQPVERNTQALVICWDMSPSMLAEDLKPSRLQRSRLKLIDLLKSRTDGQVGLIAYSGEAYNVTPLTDDFQTIINLLPALGPTSLPTVGSNPEMALNNAIQLLKDAKINRGNILFITDSIDPSAFDSMTSALSATPHKLSIWGLGTSDGAPIPLPNGGFAKDGNGVVIAKLNEDELRQFAKRQNGYYLSMVTTDEDIKILGRLLDPQAKQTEQSDRVFDQWFEHGQFFALFLLPFAASFFRKGWIFGLLVLLSAGTFAPQQAQAFEWDQLWLNQDQLAQKQLREGQTEAAKKFSAPDRRGSALYHNKSYEDAAQEFAQGQKAEDAYNQGNALAHAGKFDDAVKSFNRSLEIKPDFKEAQDNRAVAQQLAKMQKQNKDDKKQSGDGQSDKNQKSDDQKQQGDDQKEADSQKGDQQKQDGQKQDSAGENKDQANEQQSASDAQNQQDKQDQDKKDQKSGAANKNEEMTDAQAQKQQAEQKDPKENPFSQTQQKTDEKQQADDKKQQASIAQQQKDQDAQQENKDQQLAQTGVPQTELQNQPQTEQQQMLEQWLRKVPDDPSGLMRNKFKYQYMQRTQQGSPDTNKQAERRW